MILIAIACTAVSNGQRAEDSTDSNSDTAILQTHRFIDVKLAYYGGCALDDAGEVLCWGNSNYGVDSPPNGVFTALSSAAGVACALDQGGGLYCWGSISPFADAFDAGESLAAIDVADDGLCGLRSDGTSLCWGNDVYGEYDPPSMPLAAIQTDGHESCGLDLSGHVMCWGGNLWGQDEEHGETFSALSLTEGQVCGIEAETNNLVTWGWGSFSGTPRYTESVAAIACGQSADCALLLDGSVGCWGHNPGLHPGPYVAVAVDIYALACGVRDIGTIDCWYDGDQNDADSTGALDVPL